MYELGYDIKIKKSILVFWMASVETS